MKNILIVNKYFFPTIGGVESVVKNHALELSKHHNVTVLCASDKPTKKTVIENNGRVTVIRSKTWAVMMSMPISLSLAIYLLRNSKSYDQIHLHEPFPIGTIFFYIFRRHVKRVSIYYHSDIVKQKFWIKIIEHLQLSNLERASNVLTSSPNLRHHSSVLRKLQRKVEIVPIWLDDTERSEEISAYKDTHEPVFLYLGRNSYYKGIDLIIDAFKAYKDRGGSGRLIIAGDDFSGNLSSAGFSTDEDWRIINRPVTEQEKEELLRTSDCLVFPSLHKSEAFGIVQLEAMRMGLPVINSNLKTGVPWVSINNETGITISVGSKKELIEAFLAIEDKNLRRNFSIAAQKRYETVFSKKNCSSSFRSALGFD